MAKTDEETTCPPSPVTSQSDDGSGHYTAYEEHARTLRTWLVAYGIGAPVLILSQDKLWEKLAAAGSLRFIAMLFLTGVALQVLLAALNKSAMWACYFGTVNESFRNSRRYRWGETISGYYWIDLAVDIISMAVFAWATYLCFAALVT